MYRESHMRSIIKTLLWRFIATIITMVVVFIFTKKITIAVAIGSMEMVLKTFIYFLYERTWNKINFGKEKQNLAHEK